MTGRPDCGGQFRKCLFNVSKQHDWPFLAFRQVVLPFFEWNECFQFVVDACRNDFVGDVPAKNSLDNLHPSVDFTADILLLDELHAVLPRGNLHRKLRRRCLVYFDVFAGRWRVVCGQILPFLGTFLRFSRAEKSPSVNRVNFFPAFRVRKRNVLFVASD